MARQRGQTIETNRPKQESALKIGGHGTRWDNVSQGECILQVYITLRDLKIFSPEIRSRWICSRNVLQSIGGKRWLFISIEYSNSSCIFSLNFPPTLRNNGRCAK